MRDPNRLARLITILALATWWRLAFALPRVHHELEQAAAPHRGVCQLPLPWAERRARPPRPWVAKFSLLSWGAKVARTTDLRHRTPPLQWTLPPWSAFTWTAHCHQVTAT